MGAWANILSWLKRRGERGKLHPLFPEEVRKPTPNIVETVRPRGVYPAYRVYTRAFDRIVHARELDTVLGTPGPVGLARHKEAIQAFESALQSWQIQSETTTLDAGTALRAATPDMTIDDTVVTLLIDQSGSMRGDNIAMAAAATDIARNFLRHIGCRVEVLGFTTTRWQGGASRQKWLSNGRPPMPGRLCDLLHIIYQGADEPPEGGSDILEAMLQPELLKENLDGEALEWAAERLNARPEASKILIIISDGAPVDDATLAANDAGILDRHLKTVISRVELQDNLTLAAIGIGHDVSRYYKISRTIEKPTKLTNTLMHILYQTLEIAWARRE